VGFAVSFRSCRAIQGGFLLLAMLCSYLVSDTWSLPSLSRSTRMAIAEWMHEMTWGRTLKKAPKCKGLPINFKKH